jgi:hypothetical protein
MALSKITTAARTITGMTTTVACIAVLAVGFVWLRTAKRAIQTQPLGVKSEQGSQREPAALPPTIRPMLDGAARKFREGDPSAARIKCEELRRALLAFPTNAAATAIRDFLDSRADAATGLSFKVGTDGFLTESPSLRVFLLDYLAQIDAAAAAAYATTILATMESPDEWAVALRSYAAANPTSGGRSFLAQKLQAMLTHDDWVREPSTGFLEAFDVAVYLGGTNLVPTVAGLLQRRDNEPVSHAAYLVLDRLTLQDPTTTLAALQASPQWMQGREVTRANYFARADVREAQQRQILEEYLLSPNRTAAELQTFAGLYPNANLMVSANLLTRVQSPGHEELVSRDIAAWRAAQEWLTDPRFQALKPHLEKIRIRLEIFVQQAHSGQ